MKSCYVTGAMAASYASGHLETLDGLALLAAYPICLVNNQEADAAQTKAAEDFMKFVLSDESKEVFESYYFDTDVE